MYVGKVLLRSVPVRGAVEVDVDPSAWLLLAFANSLRDVLPVAFARWIGTEIKANGAAIIGGTEHGGFRSCWKLSDK
jgi:hypothetical protein